MPRKSIRETLEGRDPIHLAANIRRQRLRLRWSQSQLAQEAQVGRQTIVRVEKGLGCTAVVERKLAKALMLNPQWIWNPHVEGPEYRIHALSDAQWLFCDEQECEQYIEHRRLWDKDKEYRPDPEEIQVESERLRLGRNGLARGFFRTLTSRLRGERVVSGSIVELYASTPFGQSRVGVLAHIHCLRGEIEVRNGAEKILLMCGDVLHCVIKPGDLFSPIHPIGQHHQPPLCEVMKVAY